MKRVFVIAMAVVCVLSAAFIMRAENKSYTGFIPENIESVRRELKLAYENGLVDSPSFEDLMDQRDEFNADRTKKYEKGEPVYGPVTYDEVSYFYYRFSNIHIMLTEIFVDKMNYSDEQLYKVYEEQSSVVSGGKSFNEVKDVIAKRLAEEELLKEVNK